MSQSRFWPVVALVLLLVLPALPAPATAQSSGSASPESMGLTNNVFSNDAVDHAVDLNGRYSVVAVKPTSGDITNSAQHLYVFDMQSGLKQAGTDRYPFGGSDDGLTPPPPPLNGGVVAVQDGTNPSKFVAGAGERVAVYNLGGGRATANVFKDQKGTAATVVGVAMSSDGSRIAAGINYATPMADPRTEDNKPIAANLTVLDGNLAVVWRHAYSEQILAMSLRGNTLAVATKNAVYVYTSLAMGSGGAAVSCTGACRSYSMGTTPATYEITKSMALSRDAGYLLLGTESGKVWFFRLADTSLANGVRFTAGFGDGAVKGVAMNGDATTPPTIIGFAWNNGNVRVYRHDPLATSVPVTIGFTAAVPGTPAGSTGSTGSPAGLSMSNSNPYGSPPAPQPYIVVAVADKVYGYTAAFPGSGAKSASWMIDTDVTVLDAALTPDADRVIVAGVAKMLGFKQLTRAAIIPKTHLVNGLQVPLVGKSVAPGTNPVLYQFDLKNDGTTDDNYTFPWSVSPPAGFADERPSGIGLKAGERRTVNVNISVPSNAESKSYAFTLLVHSRLKNSANDCGADGTRVCAIQFFANVTRVSRVEVVPTQNQLRNFTVTPAGTEFTFDVRNVGNAPAKVNLTVQQRPPAGLGPWTVNLSKQFNLNLAGGASDRITGLVTPTPSALNGQFMPFDVYALVNDTAAGAPLAFRAVLNPSYGIEITTEKETYELLGGKKTPILVTVRNGGNTEETVDIAYNITPKSALNKDYRLEAPTSTLTLPTAGGTKTWTLYVSPAADFPEQATITIDAVVKETLGTATVKKDSLTITILRAPDDVPPPCGFFCRLVPAPDLGLLVMGLALVALALRKR